MQQKISSFRVLRSLAFPPATMSTILIIYLLLNVGLAYTMLLFPALGLIGAIVINLIVLFFLRSWLALPLYIVTAGPSVVLLLSSSGILSRLYIGNLLFVLVVSIWILQTILPNRKSGRMLLEPSLLLPLTALSIVGLISIIYSRLFPDPNVRYTYPHANVPITLVNLSEMGLLIGLPMFLVIVPGMVRTARDVRWFIGAYMLVGTLYALGTIFAGPLGLYSGGVILGNTRPVVFGSTSSALGIMIEIFTCIALGQTLYTTNNLARILWGLLTFMFTIALIMTFGRESWIGLFLAVLTMIGFRTKNWTVLLVPLAGLLLLLIPGVSDFFNPAKTYGADRLNIWADAIAIWQRSPYMGIGAGNYQFFDLTYGTDVVALAHNQYLQVLAEMGVQGLLCLIWLIVAVGRRALKSLNAAKTHLGKSVALTYLGFYASTIFGGFFTGIFIPSAASGGGTAPFVESSYRWLLLGLVLSIPIWEKEPEKSEREDTQSNKKAIQQSGQEIVRISR
jgi:O-antigen ligase